MSIEVAGGLLLIDDQHEWARGRSRCLEGFGRHRRIVGARRCDPQASSFLGPPLYAELLTLAGE